MATIYLIRHCESEGNACRRAHAQSDSLVTIKGYAQAEALGKRFADIPLDAVYASDTYRSIVTALPIAQTHGLKVKTRIALREVTTGIWEDASWGNIALEYPELCKKWMDSPWEEETPGATTLQQVADRILFFLRKTAEELGPNGAAVMVTHSVAIKATLCAALGKPLQEVLSLGHGENTSVSRLNIDEKGNITAAYLNEVSHLPQALRRAWSGLAGGSVNMAEYACDLNDESQRAALLRLAKEAQGNAPFDAEAFLSEVSAALEEDPACIALGYLDGEIQGFIWIAPDSSPKNRSIIKNLFVTAPLQGHGYSEQLLGHMIHVLRYRDSDGLVIHPEQGGEAARMAERFLFHPDQEQPNELVLDLYSPLYHYRVLA